MNHQLQFDELHEKYQGMVLQLCLGYSKGVIDFAKDLSQDVFVNVWNALPKFEGRSSYKTWIYRITVNTCLMQMRNLKKMQTESIDDKHLNQESRSEDHNYNALYVAIGQLKEVDRLLIMLVLDDLTYEEIAEIMGVNQVNLRVKIHRVKEKLKNMMK
jgi:RNA polymerase sigma-70 factor (ECF subfamily)